MIPGVDVGSFQGEPGQWKAEAGPIRWAAVKITELEPDGTRYVNPDAAADWAYLHEQGLGRIGYLYGHPAVPASETVAFFAEQIDHLGLEDGDGVALDHEITDGLGPSAVSTWAVAVTTLMRREFARRPVVYTFLDFALEGNCAGLGHHPLWMSDPSSPPGHPRIPPPWKTADLHQYDTSGNLDKDVAMYETDAAMAADLGRTGWVTWQASGDLSLIELAHQTGAQPSTVLRNTVAHFGKFPEQLAHYLDRGDLNAKLEAGTRIRVPKLP